MLDVSPLFAPLPVRGKMLRNRIAMPPMVVNRGIGTRASCDWYGRHAQGGVGLVIVEATDVVRFGVDLDVAPLRALAEAIHAGGALAAIQVFPGVRLRGATPEQLTPALLDALVEQFATAARLCAEAGFDGIEPHGAHGFLLNQFFSPVQNRRTDEYGGPIANRMRLALRIVQAVHPLCGDGMLLLYRHTPVGQGYGIAESLELARELVAAGVDILDLSPSSSERPGDRAAPFKALGVPVITVNDLDVVGRALEVLREERADLVAVGRGLIADPDWPLKVHEGLLDQIVTCTKCDDCFADLRHGGPVGCTQWA
jgi:NADPH2 dehydrogenase